MLKGKRAIIFDLDGTLVDSMWMWNAIDVEYLGQFGHACPDDLQKAIEGMSFSETAAYFKKRFVLQDTLEKIKADWTRMSLDKYKHEVPLKPGVMEFLQHARDLGLKMGIATSNSREMAEAVIDSLEIKKYFSQITTACEVAAGKPAPDIYLKVAEDLKVLPGDCIVFEDVPAGIIAGKQAGMTVCAVDDEFSQTMKEEKCSLADYFITDYYEILNGAAG